MRPLEVLDQADARGLVLDQDQVHALSVPAFPVDHLVLVLNLGAQIRILEAILPAVQQQGRHRAVHGLEDAPGRSRGGVVDGLLAGGAVVGLEDVLELGEGLVHRPELEHVPLDDASLLRVDDLSVDLLPAQLRPLVLQDLLLEARGEVGKVGVGRGRG